MVMLRNSSTTTLAVATLALVFAAGQALASARNHGPRKACPRTAWMQLAACKQEIHKDLYEAAAICENESDEAREQCRGRIWSSLHEMRELCSDQFEARVELCSDLGEDRYDPVIDPLDFDDDFANPTEPNPYFPLAIGNHWVYEGGDEVITVEVTGETKLIQGVTCIVVTDVVVDDGELIEDTDDWYGVRKNGTVDYFGEIAKNFATFAGDDPEVAELVDVDGSFKAGRDGAKSGSRMPATPTVGNVYREEWSLGNAEDVARIVSTTYEYGKDAELDELVPQDLAEHLCNGDCLVTENWSPIEPDARELKYYAPGVGTFLEVNLEDEEVVQLVECGADVDPKCTSLP